MNRPDQTLVILSLADITTTACEGIEIPVSGIAYYCAEFSLSSRKIGLYLEPGQGIGF
jgi:hypothetical protein